MSMYVSFPCEQKPWFSATMTLYRLYRELMCRAEALPFRLLFWTRRVMPNYFSVSCYRFEGSWSVLEASHYTSQYRHSRENWTIISQICFDLASYIEQGDGLNYPTQLPVFCDSMIAWTRAIGSGYLGGWEMLVDLKNNFPRSDLSRTVLRDSEFHFPWRRRTPLHISDFD